MAAEVVTLTDGTNSVDFLDGTYIYQNIQGLDPPTVEIIYAGDKPVHRKWQNREITIAFGINATTTVVLEQKKRTFITILENTYLYFVSRGVLGAKAQLQYRKEGATDISYADAFWGECDWGRVEYQEGAVYAYQLKGAQLTLTCEPFFHPSSTTNLADATTIYNHDDSGHDNYVDIAGANIKGDVGAPVIISLEWQAGSWKNVRIARRTRGTPSSFVHVREAEDATSTSNFAIDTKPAASNGEILANSANASGYATWGIPPTADLLGRFLVLARAYTDDITNTQLRLRYRFINTVDWVDNDWAYFPAGGGSQYECVPLGTMHCADKLPSGKEPNRIWIQVEYSKDAADTIELDCIMLLPEDESACRILSPLNMTSGRFRVDETLALPYTGKETSYDFEHHLAVQPSAIMLKPGTANRLYFQGEGGGTGDNEWLTAASLDVSIDYLPMYLIPLE